MTHPIVILGAGPRFATAAEWLQGLSRIAPKAGMVLALLVGGLIASSIARRLTRTLVRRTGLETVAEKAGIARALYAVGSKHGLATFLGSVVYFIGIAITLSAISDTLGLTVVSTLVSSAVRYLPRALTACAILFAAFVAAGIARSFVRGVASQQEDVKSPEGVGTMAYAAVVVLGAMLAAEQAGIAVTMLQTLLQVIVGLIGLGLALAFALGFHSVFRGMAARHYYKPMLHVGDKVRVGDDEGTVAGFGPTTLILRTPEGDRIVPCTRLLRTTVVVKSESGNTGSNEAAEGSDGTD